MMLHVMQILAIMLVALAMAPAVAHAAELPGKKRLSRETYIAVQPIYYPGFTILGAVGEFGGLLATIAVLFITDRGSTAFWLTLIAVLALLSMQAVFWIFIQPVNRFWLEREKLGRLGARFFSVGAPGGSVAGNDAPDWTTLRDRWEYSHAVRAGLATLSLLALVIASVIPS